jgi:hypothetical protein
VVAGFLDGNVRIAVWVLALAIDYLGPVVIGIGRGWQVAAEHFAERFGLIVLIALGESIIAIGFGAAPDLEAGVLVAAALGFVVVSALWWLYFDVAAIFARRRLLDVSGVERARLARDSYAYLPFRSSLGVVLFAFGLETTLHNVGDPLDVVPAVALCVARPSTCLDTSRSSSGRPITSSAGGRSGRRCCSPSSRLRSRSRRSLRSPSSARCAVWWWLMRHCAIAPIAGGSATQTWALDLTGMVTPLRSGA